MFDSFGSIFNASSYANAGAGTMLAGAILVSSPVIIHLINRMRFKRIRWAAMEFLLKAQKRMKRKMIIEQLILLLLRILMVFLFGLLIARFFGFGGDNEARQSVHVILLDDSPSMADTARGENGANSTAFEVGKALVFNQILPNLEQATTKQRAKILLLSETVAPPTVVKKKEGEATANESKRDAFTEVKKSEIQKLKDDFARVQAGNVRVPLQEGLRKAVRDLDDGASQSGTGREIHVITDFRSPDWVEGGKAIKDEVEKIKQSGIKIVFIDVAHPIRRAEDKRAPQFHDNIAITDLQSSKAVVAKYESVDFTLKVTNFGSTQVTGKRFVIKVNGDESKGKSTVVPQIGPGQTITEKFTLSFDRSGTAENPFERFSLVTVAMAEEEQGGLESDNVRHAVVEVRDKHSILVIDGNPEIREKREGNSLFLQRYFTGADEATQSNYRWVPGDVNDLKKPDISKYAFIFILNVATIPEDSRIGLENYVKGGGGVSFFLGPNVRPADYNTILYRDGKGLFPFPLPEQPSKELTEEERVEKILKNLEAKLLLRNPDVRTHPAVSGLYTDERGQILRDTDSIDKFYKFVMIYRYWPVKRGKWGSDPSVKEIYCLQNEEPMTQDYEKIVREIVDALPNVRPDPNKKEDHLPKALERVKINLRRAGAESKTVGLLAAPLDELLVDHQAVTADKEDIALREFWARPDEDIRAIRNKAVALRNTVKYGDPFYVVKEFEKGRVAVFTSTSGETWNDWAAGSGRASFPPVMKELSTYMVGGTVEKSVPAGYPIDMKFDGASYKPEYRSAYLTHIHDPRSTFKGAASAAPITNPENGQMETKEIKETIGEETKTYTQLNLSKKQTKEIGAYLFELKQLVPGAKPTDPVTEVSVYKAATVNIEADLEGNLARTHTDDVKAILDKVPFFSSDETSKITPPRKKSDLSEIGWLFGILFLILVIEQAMSVRLSYHASADSTSHAAPSAAAAMRGPTRTENQA